MSKELKTVNTKSGVSTMAHPVKSLSIYEEQINMKLKNM